MQFKVPQDVQQADRIVAFLTLPQLIICVVGFAVSYGVYAALYNQGLPMVFWLPPVIVIGALTLAFAFLKIANLPFHQYLALLLERFITPSRRVWVKGGDRVIDDIAYVSTEDKQQQDKNKKMNEAQLQKEEKMQSIEEITNVLDALKNEPKAEVLAPIDATPDEDLLQTAFLEKTPVPVKRQETTEEKIKALSQLPKAPIPSTPVVNTAPTMPSSENLPSGEQKKRKRRRRRKKKTGEQGAMGQMGPTMPPASPNTSKPAESEDRYPRPPAPTQVQPRQPSPAPEIKKPAINPGSGPEQEPALTKPVQPSTPAPQKPSEPPLPSWLNEKPTESEDRNPRPPAPPAEQPRPPAQPEKKVEPVPAVAPTPVPPTQATEPVKTEPKKEEPLLEAPLEELDLPAPPVELDLPAPPVELDLPAPKESSATPTPSLPTSPQEPTSPEPSPKTIKIEESFSAEELKGAGQVIKIPKQ